MCTCVCARKYTDMLYGLDGTKDKTIRMYKHI